MLPKSHRLSKKEIKEFFSKKFRTCRSEGVLLRVAPNTIKNIRAAFIISSEVKRNAPARNTTRRRMSAVVSGLIKNNHDFAKHAHGKDFVFSFKLSRRAAPAFLSIKKNMNKALSLCGLVL